MAVVGRVTSWLEDFDQDEIDFFVLTHRILTQNNDALSIALSQRSMRGHGCLKMPELLSTMRATS